MMILVMNDGCCQPQKTILTQKKENTFIFSWAYISQYLERCLIYSYWTALLGANVSPCYPKLYTLFFCLATRVCFQIISPCLLYIKWSQFLTFTADLGA